MLERNLSALEVELNKIRESSRRTKSSERDLGLSPQPLVALQTNHGAKTPTTGAHHWREPSMNASIRHVFSATPGPGNGHSPQTSVPAVSARDNAQGHTDIQVSRDSTNGDHRNDNAATPVQQRLPTPVNGQSLLSNLRGPEQNAANYVTNTAIASDRQSPAHHVQTNRSHEQDPFLTGMPNVTSMSNSPAFFDSFFSMYDDVSLMAGAGELSGTLGGMLSGPFV